MFRHLGSRHLRADGSRHPRRGVALLVALGVLVVLALLGAVFATLTGIERSVARNYIDKVRARLLAESGIEAAFGKLSTEHGKTLDIWNATGPMDWIFYGLDTNGDGLVNAGESSAYSHTLPTGEVVHDWNRVPLEEATRPSFPLDRNGNGSFDSSDLMTIDGNPAGCSGMTDVGTYASQGNLYVMKVTDLQSRINVNNRHTHLARIINNVARRLSLPAGLGETIIAVRDRLPGQTLTTLDQLIPRVPRTTVDRIRPYLTVNGWVDTRAIRPIGLDAGKRRRNLNVGDGVYAYHELRPRAIDPIDPITNLPTRDFEPRSPVNINTAPFEVLAALMEGLSGFYLQESRNPWTDINPYDFVGIRLSFSGTGQRLSGKVGEIFQTPEIGPNTADNIAREIMKARLNYPSGTTAGPVPAQSVFRNYQQLAQFFNELPSSVFDPGEITAPPGIPLDILQNEIRHLLKEMFDPNVHLNELNPDEMLYQKIDKTDLFYWTTEFCFVPMGHFEVESLGRVVDGQQREVASAKIYVHAKLFDVHRDTTQADFMRDFYLNDDNNALDIPGSRGAIESRLARIFSKSGANAYPVDGHWASFPEYFMEPRYMKDSCYDGYLTLMNLWANPNGAALRARFMPAAGASPSTAFKAFSASNRGDLIKDAGGGPWYDMQINGTNPGTLMSDGAFSEKDTSPAYPNAGNFNQHIGTLAYWVKPAFEPERAGKVRLFFRCFTYDMSGYEYSPSNGLGCWPFNGFAMVYLANHDMTRYPETTHPIKYQNRTTLWPTRSIAAGFGGSFNRRYRFWTSLQANSTNSSLLATSMRERVAFNATGTLNHIGHGHNSIPYLNENWGNFLVQGRWMHVGMLWNDYMTQRQEAKVWLYINGLPVERTATGQNVTSNWPNSVYGEPATVSDPANPTGPSIHYVGLPADIHVAERYLGIDGIPPPPLRLGGEAQSPPISAYMRRVDRGYAANNPTYPCNFPADSTFDEFMVWPGIEAPNGAQKIRDMWMEGRFYKSYGSPNKGATTGSLANFTSSRISVRHDVTTATVRPPGGTATLPAPVTPPPPPSSGIATSEQVQMGIVAYTLRIPDYNSMAITYANPSNQPPSPRVYVDILDADSRDSLLTGGGGTAVLGNVANTAFHLGGGAITVDATPAGQAVQVDTSRDIRYRLWLDAGLVDRLNDPFMATPVIDDVLLTYSRMKPEILSWWVND